MDARTEQLRQERRGPSSSRGPRIKEVRLQLPDGWAIRVGPNAVAMERRALLWLTERGIIHDEASAEKFRRLSVGEYASWPFPMATPRRAETITKFLSLWMFYDDAIEAADDHQAETIHDAIRALPEKFAGGDAYLRCWWELGQEYGRTMSRSWLDRHATRFSHWVASVQDERIAGTAFRALGTYPKTADHLARRRDTIGMTPNLDFLEYQMGWELPNEVLRDPLMQRVERCAAEAVAIMNDLFGFSKDRASRWSNLVSCWMSELDVSAADAFESAAELHNSRVQELARVELELLSKYAHIPELGDWFVGLHYVIYGFTKWHSRAPRYASSHQVREQEIRIKIDHV